MRPLSPESITIDEISGPTLATKSIQLSVLRLDKIHPVISGNKWFKLGPYFKLAEKKGLQHIVSFGGAYSNHILALAAAGSLFGFRTTGIIRGEHAEEAAITIELAESLGMKMFFQSRENYRLKLIPVELQNQDDPFLLVNEGGFGAEGAEGAAEILKFCPKENYSHIVAAVGTSTMLAGLVKASLPTQEVVGISVLKNNLQVGQDFHRLLSPAERMKQVRVVHDYHFGGYAKRTPELIDFMNHFYRDNSIPSDFVYTGKLFFAVMDMIAKGQFPNESNILMIHSGGLQGNLSLPKKTLIF